MFPCRRDIEAEMIRFDGTLETEKEKYSMMELPTASQERKITVCVDAISTCCLGVPHERP
jgi:hypothetical protein